MNQITMTDITMNQNTRRAEFSLSFREKIELAKLLDRLGVDAILTTPITENRSDSLLIKSISSAVKESAVAVPVGLEPAKVDLALKALTEAVHPRLVAEAPVSAVQMEYLAGKKPAALLAAIEDTVSKASALCQDVEFVAVDATRADMAFLKDALTTAIRSGAGIITLVDTAGDMLPEEFAAFINEVRQNVPDLGNVRLPVITNLPFSLFMNTTPAHCSPLTDCIVPETPVTAAQPPDTLSTSPDNSYLLRSGHSTSSIAASARTAPEAVSSDPRAASRAFPALPSLKPAAATALIITKQPSPLFTSFI